MLSIPGIATLIVFAFSILIIVDYFRYRKYTKLFLNYGIILAALERFTLIPSFGRCNRHENLFIGSS